MDKTVVILQSNYIPWKGYFDLMNRADEFVIYDDARYTTRDWRNRNRIKTRHGLRWLTIPVVSHGLRWQPIKEVVISDPGWTRRHWGTLVHSYAHAPYFARYAERLERLYLDCCETRLSAVNLRFLDEVRSILEIKTRLRSSAEFELAPGATERLVGVCKQTGATRYLTGPSARAYLDESLFEDAGIAVEYMSYDGYPPYEQLYPPFEHAVSILDLLFQQGPEAHRSMLSFEGDAHKSSRTRSSPLA